MSDKGDFRTRDVTKDRDVTTLQDIVTQGQHTTCDLQHADTHGKTEKGQKALRPKWQGGMEDSTVTGGGFWAPLAVTEQAD